MPAEEIDAARHQRRDLREQQLGACPCVSSVWLTTDV